MKLAISLCAALCVAGLARWLGGWLENNSLPSGDFATQALRRGIQNLLAKETPLLSRYARHIKPLTNEITLPGNLDFSLFLALHGLAGFLICVLVFFAAPGAAIWVSPMGLGAGVVLPYAWLKHKHAQFHVALLKALPECLELQALVMEAGLDLTAGMQHYLRRAGSNPLHGLLQGVQKEIQMGRSRADAFAALARRTSFIPLREVCRSIVQALALGSPLAPLLREQASALRIKRMQIAEKKAAEAPLKILFPLFVFIFPTIFIVLLGPMAMMFVQGGF